MKKEELQEVLDKHRLWLQHRKGGVRADLTGANLYEANLSGANLSGANLYKANLYEANLHKANLYEANLSGAYLCGANLSGAYLCGANLYKANLSGANLYEANLSGANLSGANLRGADLSGADLTGANLYEANLSGANLSGANLYKANLSGANLRGAAGLSKYITTPLYLLLDQIGKIRAYKLVNSEDEGPFYGSLKYKIGKKIEVDNWDCNEETLCSDGISLATLDWCIKEWKEGYKILLVEFDREDIVAIPIGSDGKFRVKSCTPIAEKNLKELGLIKE